jgi:hypothetical protein
MKRSAFWSLPQLLCHLAPLAFGQAGPVSVTAAPSIYFAPSPPCKLSSGSISLSQPSANAITISKLSLNEEDSPFPSLPTKVQLRSPYAGAGPYQCNPRSLNLCEVRISPPLDLSEGTNRPLLFAISVGLAEMVLEFESGAPCSYRLSPESSMSPRVEATIPVNGPSDSETFVPGELRVSFAPSGCSDEISAAWQAKSGSIPKRFPLTLELETNGVKCSYGQLPDSPESPNLKLTQPTAQPPGHDHTQRTTRLTGLSFSKPRKADGSPSAPFMAIKETP